MGTELVRPCVKEENMEISPIPPGFESFTSFTLKRVEDKEVVTTTCASVSASDKQAVQLENKFETGEDAKFSRPHRNRPWINYSQFDDSSGDESDSEQKICLRPSLPKGVIRGCMECSNCQKVTARWRPDEARRLDLEDAPVFYPNEEEFKDTIKYIATIRSKAEKYGICRIVPPSSWKPPCPLKEKSIWERSKFPTRIQRIDKLQNRDSMKKLLKTSNNKRRKRRRCTKNWMDYSVGTSNTSTSDEAGNVVAEGFGFEPGPEFALDTFEKYANDFKVQYFRKNSSVNDPGNMPTVQEQWEPTVENIEGEYWRMVERPTEQIEVLYGADLETGVFGSGFPKLSNQGGSVPDEEYVKSGWNLNNFPRLPGSVLSYESTDISGVLVPWLYIGMCFSSFCWHVEDHHLYSLNYMHWGAPKLWYGVPGDDALKLEAAMRKHLPDLFDEQPDLLHKLVTQLSPSILKSEGVPVCRCVQNPGEFVLTFPRAYHSGFNCGFNCAEAVNVAPVDWLPHGQNAIELYCQQGRKTSVSHDKLLLGAAREAVKAHWELNLLRKNTSDNLRWRDLCGKDGILTNALRTRVEIERARREFLCKSSRAVKMESNFDATSERECSVCLFDLHLSAAGCHCSPEMYTCLNHAKHLCSCSWSAKFFLFRYDISELNMLVEALEGKLSAVYRWARLDLGLALSSHISKDNLQVHGLGDNVSHLPQETQMREMNSQPSVSSLKEMEGKKKIDKVSNSFSITGGACLTQKEMSCQFVLGLEAIKVISTSSKSLHEVKVEDDSPQIKKGGDFAEEKKPFFLGNCDVILLSDDEGEESKSPASETANETSVKPTEDSQRPMGSAKMSATNCIEVAAMTKPMTKEAVMYEKDASFLPVGENNNHSSSDFVKGEGDGKTEVLVGCNPHDLSSHRVSSSTDYNKNIQDFSNARDTGDSNVTKVGLCTQPHHPFGSEIPNNVDRQKMGFNASLILVDDGPSASGSPSCTQNNLDRYFRQKGPRIAKVVRRINCNVEPLEYGFVHSGKWCDSRAIFPKGFKSRVRYINVLDPANACYYVSEILDAGRDVPFFMVSLENCPSEVFVHVSAAKCWDMVRERVNQEITRQHKLGRTKLPPLQPPGSLDGMEMFGFSSPAIVQVIQSMDRNRVCTEYWKSRPLMQIPQHPQAEESTGHSLLRSDIANDNREAGKNFALPARVDSVLSSLFKKANPEELHALYDLLRDNRPTSDQSLVNQLLVQEIHNRPR
ncbi:putative lysine-specific demethylase JMJ16 [Diospyros lotus]|uniref:putative lysine-specific demethylase JMJ16 n=1 Tax=Diospyros lotus TaxID=55363 RepID=UPI002255BCC3|nr:putative lysine-specific demethylase JMJ16 [Diospyros lotus]XP_052187674.1 putative lysine-specific demethylase JMJ16 [Diospyros lotus]XP_052187680.1 putative lysine-specific demethylase JMJ16 [Diospyros lotus]XP_052187689.1 putative lysine-specific demethylase JMJ16 [Diospyros lotus]XP_052187696.1 putative lysine-specific demethylase JMJ16 [Diospyros lotus]XP_052187703.1 putative lysine-specific demethylase JMJ16 [Diospyros lotus]XP_052187711.1 putative lysine-specific demethylase JMJ16 [